MSKVCEISGKRVMFGNNVSKALKSAFIFLRRISG
jgi:ribosomal protein L28